LGSERQQQQQPNEQKMKNQIETMRRMSANETWKQIPVMDKMAIGARKATIIRDDEGDEAGLRINVLRGNRTTIEIVLHWSDTYVVELVKYRKARKGEAESYHFGISNTKKMHRQVVGRAENVYCDSLGEAVYTLTHGDRRN
jgi:hypothetical protein